MAEDFVVPEELGIRAVGRVAVVSGYWAVAVPALEADSTAREGVCGNGVMHCRQCAHCKGCWDWGCSYSFPFLSPRHHCFENSCP